MALRWKPTTSGIKARTAMGTWFIDDSEGPATYYLDWYSDAGGRQIGRFSSLLDAQAKAEDLTWRLRQRRRQRV